MKTKLNNCPFCGGRVRLSKRLCGDLHYIKHEDEDEAASQECYLLGFNDNLKDGRLLVSMWNTRMGCNKDYERD